MRFYLYPWKLICLVILSFIMIGTRAQNVQNTVTTSTSLTTLPIKFIVGAPAGGSTDSLARIMATFLSPKLNRTILVENKPGAGGNIAAEFVANSSPDGNTFLVCFTSHAINASLYPKLNFDPVNDFSPIGLIATSPSLLVASPNAGISNLAQLLSFAKQNPGKLNFAIGALGSSLHLAGEDFKMLAGVNIINIPYKGTAPAIQDLLAGHVQLMFAPIGNTQQHIKAGKLIALGVTSSKKLADFPTVPTISEYIPGFESNAWFGILGPRSMKNEAVQEFSIALQDVLHSQNLHQRIQSEGAQVAFSTPKEFKDFLQSEIIRLRKVVQFSGAKPE